MWQGFVNALKNVFSPPKSTPRPAVQNYVNSKPSINVPKAAATINYSPPKVNAAPSYSAPKISAPSPSISRPSTSFSSPVQSSGVKISLPSYSSPAQTLKQNPISPITSMKTPNYLQDLKNVGSGNLKQTLGGITGLMGTAGTTLLKNNPFTGPAFNFQQATTNRNPLEFGFSEALSALAPVMNRMAKPVQASTNTTAVGETSGGMQIGDRWVSADTLANNKKMDEEFRTGGGLNAYQKEQNISTQAAQLQRDYQSGKISFNQYNTQMEALRNLAPMGYMTDYRRPETGYPSVLAKVTGSFNPGEVAPAMDTNTINKSYSYANTFATDPTKTGQSSIDTYNSQANSINSKIENAVNNIIREYESGNMSVEDANSRIAEAQKRELYASRDRQVNDANASVTSLDKDLQDYIAQENIQTQRYKDEAAQQEAQKQSLYGEMLKKSAKNATMSEGDLRNTFAALGTAESSSFMDKLTNLKGEVAGEQGAINRQSGTEIASLKKDVMNKVLDSTNRISTTQRKTGEQKTQIQQAIRDLVGSTDDKIFTLMADLASKTASGKQAVSTAIAGLYSQLLTNYTNQQNAGLTNTNNQKLLADNYQTTTDLNNLQSGTYDSGAGTLIKGVTRPKTMPQDMWDTAYQMMKSGVNVEAVMNSLKQQAGMNPVWAPWIGTMDTVLGTNRKTIA